MFNLALIVRNTRILMTVVSLAVPGWASSAEIRWTPEQDEAGFTTLQPGINMDALVDEVVTLKVSLRHDEKQLSRQVKEKEITNSDTVLSILLPGGLMYAAYKKNAYNKVVNKHKLVLTQIDTISADIIALTRIDGPIVVAKK